MTRVLIMMLLGGALAGCASQRPANPGEDTDVPRERVGAASSSTHALSGVASYYGERFHGRTTACGEPFDMHRFTAAHRTLPFHTVVRVVDPATRKSVVVRINDRGPFKKGRVIDLSRAAAQDLDMIQRGKIPVRLHVLSWGDGSRCR